MFRRQPANAVVDDTTDLPDGFSFAADGGGDQTTDDDIPRMDETEKIISDDSFEGTVTAAFDQVTNVIKLFHSHRLSDKIS